MKTRFLIWSFLSLFAGALALLSGCSSSPAVAPAGLWSCFDTGSGIGCVKQSALSTVDADVNGDGVPDHFVCADDDDDNHDHGRDQDQNGHALSGKDADHDGIDDDLDCSARAACQELTDDDNADRHEAGEVEHGGQGGDQAGDHDGGNHHDDDGAELHGEGSCTPPAIRGDRLGDRLR